MYETLPSNLAQSWKKAKKTLSYNKILQFQKYMVRTTFFTELNEKSQTSKLMVSVEESEIKKSPKNNSLC